MCLDAFYVNSLGLYSAPYKERHDLYVERDQLIRAHHEWYAEFPALVLASHDVTGFNAVTVFGHLATELFVLTPQGAIGWTVGRNREIRLIKDTP